MVFILDPQTDVVASVPRISRRFQKRQYKDRQFKGGEAEWKKKIEESSTVYVGNLSCYTNEYQLYELFTRCGSIKRIIMGLDRIKKTPCGFCFVEYDDRDSAQLACQLLNRTHLDGRELTIDIDGGFQEGRQYGRGTQGGQLGDERRKERDEAYQRSMNRNGAGRGVPILTRSITIVAMISIISLLLLASQNVQSSIVIRPFPRAHQHHHTNVYSSNHTAYRLQSFNETRTQFEKSFAQFLVGVMKTAKPTLLQAFIKATLADKDLKETAIAVFFDNTGGSSSGGDND